MGALDDGHFNGELENGIGLAFIEAGAEMEPEVVAIEDAVKVLLRGLGEDTSREGLRNTPLRVAKAFRDGTSGYRQTVEDIIQGALFPEAGPDHRPGLAGGAGGLVMVRDLDLFSYCESCLLPFKAKCHVGYVPAKHRVLGLSKLFRVAAVFGKRLQEPQRLAHEVCSALHLAIKPAGVAMVLQCSHIHFPDSIHDRWTRATVSSCSGVFQDKRLDAWADFLGLLRFRGVEELEQQPNRAWCPSRRSKTPSVINLEMTSAASSILQLLGDNPSRDELIGTPARFVEWLLKFRNLAAETNPNTNTNLSGLFINGGRMDPRVWSEVNLPFWSVCEHHLLPFHGVVHVGYFSAAAEGIGPDGKAVLRSMVRCHGLRLQLQERLTRQIAEAAVVVVGEDVMVAVEACHGCMVSRGIEKFGSSTATVAVLGRFVSDADARRMFLQSVPRFSSEP